MKLNFDYLRNDNFSLVEKYCERFNFSAPDLEKTSLNDVELRVLVSMIWGNETAKVAERTKNVCKELGMRFISSEIETENQTKFAKSIIENALTFGDKIKALEERISTLTESANKLQTQIKSKKFEIAGCVFPLEGENLTKFKNELTKVTEEISAKENELSALING